MTKTKLTLSLALLAATSFIPSAYAAEEEENRRDFRPYIGLEYQHLFIDYDSVDGFGYDNFYADSYPGFNIHAGSRFSKHFGVEAGYSHSTNQSKEFDGALLGFPGITGKSETEFKGINVDLLGYYPVTESVELIATAGIARWKADSKVSGAGITIEGATTDTVLRAGAGMQYNITENWNARSIVRFISADFDDTTDHGITANLGVNYAF